MGEPSGRVDLASAWSKWGQVAAVLIGLGMAWQGVTGSVEAVGRDVQAGRAEVAALRSEVAALRSEVGDLREARYGAERELALMALRVSELERRVPR